MKIINKFASPNRSIRSDKIRYIILHYTELAFQDALDRLCNPDFKVSCHYLINADGEIFQLVPDHSAAWHAGESYWKGYSKLNDSSIGIELDNPGNTLFSSRQMTGCEELCLFLRQKYNLPASAVLGHSDIAPNRKIDPGVFFDWGKLSKVGLGLWPLSEPVGKSEILLNYSDRGNDVRALQVNLRKLGYKIELTGCFDEQSNYVIRAFQAHFNQSVVLNKGIEFYRNNNSKYSWDSHSDLILTDLISQGLIKEEPRKICAPK